MLLLIVYLKSLGSESESRENSQVVRVLKQKNNITKQQKLSAGLEVKLISPRVGSRDLKAQRVVC